MIISPPNGRLKPMDVALYRRGKAYVLHRVIEVTEDGYLIRGDNTYALERVPEEAVIGVLTGFKRKGKIFVQSVLFCCRFSIIFCAICTILVVHCCCLPGCDAFGAFRQEEDQNSERRITPKSM